MNLKNLLLSILLLAYLLISAQHSFCTEADSLMVKESFIEAAKLYHLCNEQDTTNKQALISLASCYMLLGDITLAKKYYHQLENDSLYSKDAISKLAGIYESQQNLPKAIRYYTILNHLNPENPVYLRKLGGLYLQGRETKQGRESYIQALSLNPRDILTIQGLTELYLEADELSKADSTINLGINIDSSNLSLLYLKARISYRLRDYKTSSDVLAKLNTLTEINNYYNKLLGYSYLQIDSLDKAIHHLQKSLLAENDPEYALYYLALAHERKKEYDKSIWFFEEAAKAGISPNMSQYHRGLARIYSTKKTYNLVLEHYEKSLQYLNDPEVYFYMANTAEQMQKKQNKAIYYYQQYLKSGHNNAEWQRIANERVRLLKEKEFMGRKS